MKSKTIYLVGIFLAGMMMLNSPLLAGNAPVFGDRNVPGIPQEAELLEYTWEYDAYSWIDTSSGIRCAAADDTAYQVDLPFSFEFYGQLFSSVSVGTNGYINFANYAGEFISEILPTVTSTNSYIIAALWADLASNGVDEYVEIYNGSGIWVASWVNIRFLGGNIAGTFQIILDQTGIIRIQYDYTTNDEYSITGINKDDGIFGMTLNVLNTPVDNMAIIFYPHETDFTVITPSSIIYEEGTSGPICANWTIIDSTVGPNASYTYSLAGGSWSSKISWSSGVEFQIDVSGLTVGSYLLKLIIDDNSTGIVSKQIQIFVEPVGGNTAPVVMSIDDFWLYQNDPNTYDHSWIITDIEFSSDRIANIWAKGPLDTDYWIWQNNIIWNSGVPINYSLWWTGAPLGIYSLKLIANDGYGKNGVDCLNITIVAAEPADTILNQPADIYYTFGDAGPINIEWNATDATVGAAPTYTIVIDSGTPSPSQAWTSGIPIVFNASGMMIGTHTVEIIVTDGFYNTFVDQVDVYVSAPVSDTELSTPSDITYIVGEAGPIWANWTATDATLGASPTYIYQIDTYGYSSPQAWISGTPILVDVSGLSVGTHVVELVVYDGFGGSENDFINVIVDNPPVVNYLWQYSSYSWIDTVNSGITVTLNDDAVIQTTLPFTFNFYGQSFNTVLLSDNGYITFTGNPGIWGAQNLPSSNTAQGFLIAPLWSDLQNEYGGGQGLVSIMNGTGFWVISWTNIVRYYQNDVVGSWQVVLYDTGDIRFQYDFVSTLLDPYTVGLNMGDGNHYNRLDVVDITTNDMAILFTPGTVCDAALTHPDDINFNFGAPGPIWLEWNVIDDDLGSDPTYDLVIDGMTTLIAQPWSTGTSITYDVSGFGVGNHIIELFVYDDLGGFVQDLVYVTVTGVNQAPVLDSPNDVTIELNAPGPIWLTWIPTDLIVSGPTWDVQIDGTWYLGTAQPWTSGTPIGIDISFLSLGTHTIEIFVWDGNGLSASDVVMVTVEFTGTNHAPVLSSPVDLTYELGSTGPIWVEWTATDMEVNSPSYELYLDGSLVYSTIQVWNSGDAISFNAAGLSFGTHMLEIIVYDGFGASSSDIVFVDVIFTGINNPPIITKSPDLTIADDDNNYHEVSWAVYDDIVGGNQEASVWILTPGATDYTLIYSDLPWIPGTSLIVSINFYDLDPGTYQLKIILDDGLGGNAESILTLTIEAVAPPPDNDNDDSTDDNDNDDNGEDDSPYKVPGFPLEFMVPIAIIAVVVQIKRKH